METSLGQTEQETTNTSPPETVTIMCPHCHKEIVTDQLKEFDCQDCSNTFLSIQIIKCSECEAVYCLDCSDNHLNEQGFCEDCAEVECTGCNSETDRGKHTDCNKCENVYCHDCSKLFLDDSGLCTECSDQEKIDCTDCDSRIIKNRANVCKNFTDCKNAYCNDGKCKSLDNQGYCDDCNNFECSLCENNFQINQRVACPNTNCKSNKKYCPNCFEKIKDETGKCMDCSSEEKLPCNECGATRYAKLTNECTNCRRLYCFNCEELIPCSTCNKKVCSKCGARCSECQKPYCNECMKFKQGKCKEHRGFWSKIWSLG